MRINETVVMASALIGQTNGFVGIFGRFMAVKSIDWFCNKKRNSIEFSMREKRNRNISKKVELKFQS